MTEYAVLYAVFIVLSLYTRYKGDDADRSLLKGVNTVCFLFTLTLLMLRHPTMGSDLSGVQWVGYINFFYRVAGQSFSEALFTARHFEFGFTLFVKLVSLIWKNHQFYLAVTAFVSLLPISVLIGKKSRDPAFSWIVYTSLMTFMLLYSGLRQGMAVGAVALAFIFAEEKRPVLYIMTGIVAFSFHFSAALAFMIYPLSYLKIGKKWRTVTVIALPVVALLTRAIVKVASVHCPKYEYLFSGEDGGSYRYFLMLVALYIFCFVFSDGSDFQNAYLNFFFVACAFQMLGFFSQVAPRAGFYFVITLSVLITDVILKIEKRPIYVLAYAGGVVCFTLLAFYSIYTTDWAMAYPYHWFWEAIV